MHRADVSRDKGQDRRSRFTTITNSETLSISRGERAVLFCSFYFNLCGCASTFLSVCGLEASLTGHKEEKTSACVKKRPCQDKAIWFCHKSPGEEG